MKSAKAFAPGNISCIFQIHEDPDPAHMGSMGLGFTLDKGVVVEVSLADKTEVFFNGEKIEFPAVESVVKKVINIHVIANPNKRGEAIQISAVQSNSTGLLRHFVPRNDVSNIKISISSPLSLGGGFGLSGASALATAYAINELLDLKKEKLELAKIAHVAEVENKTGLGDVTNQYFGGCLLKTVDSSQFTVHRIPIENIPVYCRIFSKLSTKSILSDEKAKEKINNAAGEAIRKALSVKREAVSSGEKRKLFADLISISKEFTEKSGLLRDQQVIRTIQDIEQNGGHASMIMLGNGVFSNIPFDGAEEFFISR